MLSNALFSFKTPAGYLKFCGDIDTVSNINIAIKQSDISW
jgi:hypothetical protein